MSSPLFVCWKVCGMVFWLCVVVGVVLSVLGVPVVGWLWLLGWLVDWLLVVQWRRGLRRGGELSGWRASVGKCVRLVGLSVWSCWSGVWFGLCSGVLGVWWSVLVGVLTVVAGVGVWPLGLVVVSALGVVWGLLVVFHVVSVWRLGWVKKGVRVSVRRFVRKFGGGWLSVLGVPVLVGVVMVVVSSVRWGVWWSVASLLVLCGLLWLVDSRRQLDRWRLMIRFQNWFDTWTADGLKQYVGVRVVQADRVADTVVVRLRFPSSVAGVVKGGFALVAGLLESVGFTQGVLLRAWDKKGGLSSRSVRLVVGDLDSLPKLSDANLSEGLARLVADVGFARVGVAWNTLAPLCRVWPVGVSGVAWRVVLECDPAGVDRHKVGRDWVAGVVSPTPQEVLGLPVYVDPSDEFLVFGEESVKLRGEWEARVRAGRVTRGLTDELAARLPKRVGVVGVVGESLTVLSEGVRVVRVVLPDGLSVGGFVGCDSLLPGLGGSRQVLAGVLGGSPVLVLCDGELSVRTCDDSRSGVLVLRCLVWGVLAQLLGERVQVVSVSACGSGVWLARVAGVQTGEMVKVVERVKSLLNVGLCVVESVDSSHVNLWVAADEFSMGWVDSVRGFDRLKELWLAFCLAQSGLTGVGGSLPVVESVERLSAESVVEKVEVVLPQGVSVNKVDPVLDRFVTMTGFEYARVSVSEGGRCVLLVSACDPLPSTVLLPEHVESAGGLVMGVDDLGERVVWDYRHSPHLSVMGKTGAGKSSVLQSIMVQALLAGWLVCVADSQKQAADFVKWASKKCVGVAVDENHVEALIGWVDAQLDERARLCQEYGVSGVDELPVGVRPHRLLVVFDEFNGYLAGLDAKPMANPTGDVEISNMNAVVKNQVRSVGVTAGRLARVAVQGRSLGVHLLLGAQRLGRDEVAKVANANSFYRSLGKLLLGADSLAGVVSANRLREANRLQKGLMVEGGMPTGRGVYQNVQGDVVGLQAFYAGGVDRLVRMVESVADRGWVDTSRWLPASAEHYGLVGVEVAEESVEQAERVDTSGFEWNL